MTHETWCDVWLGMTCCCTLPDGHPMKAEHEADKAFFRGYRWTAEQIATATRKCVVEDIPLAPGTPADVAKRLDQVCDDLIAGRTTPAQRKGLRSATDRADRVSPSSDAAVIKRSSGG